MAGITKRVNIKAPIAIRNITPPIYGTCNNIIMTSGDILKCLCKRAQVEEILPDGSTVKITMKNYYTDNGAGLNAHVWRPKKIVEGPTVVKNNEEHIEFADTETDKKEETDNLEVNDPEVVGKPETIAPVETTEDMVVDPVVETTDAVETAEPVASGAEGAPIVDAAESDDEVKVETDTITEETPAETTEDVVVDSVEDTKAEDSAEVVDAEKEVVDEVKKSDAAPAPKKKTSNNKKSTKK